VSCHAVSPEFSQLGSGFRVASIAKTSPVLMNGKTLSEPRAPFFIHGAPIRGGAAVHGAQCHAVSGNVHKRRLLESVWRHVEIEQRRPYAVMQ
jgi:hypothetical protein